MKDLKLDCKWSDGDFVNLSENDGNVIADISEDNDKCRVIIGKDQAKQLRDWINEFLGEQQ